MATEEEMRIFEAGCKRLLRRLHSIPRRDDMYPHPDEIHRISKAWIDEESFVSLCTCGERFEGRTRFERATHEADHILRFIEARGI
jgi:hypothetical protein